MNSSIVITHKELKHEQILFLLKKFDACFDPPFSDSVNIDAYAIKLFNNACFVVAESNNDIVGVLVYYKNQTQQEIYIPYLVVDPRWQGLSIGRHMLEEMALYVESSYSTIALEVMKSNTRAIAFYQSNAFVGVMDHGDKMLMHRLLRGGKF